METTRQVVLHQSLVRPRLLAGGERQATILNFGAAFALVIITRTLWGIGAAIVLSSIAQGVLVALAKRDAQALEVTNRSIKYQKFYDSAANLDVEPHKPHVERQAPVEHLVFWARSVFSKKGNPKHAEHSGISR